MTPRKPSLHIAKITRPDAGQIIYRRHLFQRLQQGKKTPLTWISGPPGSGKTTLVSSFIEIQHQPCLWYRMDSNDIDPKHFFHCLAMACQKTAPEGALLPEPPDEKRSAIPDFFRIFFQQIFARMKPDPGEISYLVFDNYQKIPDDITLHGLLLDLLNFIPEHVRIIIISRSEPGVQFSRLKINRSLRHLDWEDLRFTREEFREVAELWGFRSLPEKTIGTLHRKMDGWIGGLVIMLRGAKKFNTGLQHIGIGTIDEIHRYFAEEVFDYQGSDTKQFLREISVMPDITVKQAHALTGDKKSCRILLHLHHNNFFVHKLKDSSSDAYHLHPMFREFLAEESSEHFSSEEITGLRRRAAILLIQENRAAEAAELFITAEDWDGLIDLIVEQAELLLDQGQNELLAQWLERIPKDKQDATPWLSYWWGKIYHTRKPREAKESYAGAFHEFCAQENWPGAFAAWIGLVDTIVHKWNSFKILDSLIDWLETHYKEEEKALGQDLRLQLAGSMIAALNIRRPESPALPKWVELAEEEVLNTGNSELALRVNHNLANYYLWRGDQSNCWVLLSRIRNLCNTTGISTLEVLRNKYLEAMVYAWLLSDGDKCLETIRQALAISRYSGLHAMDRRLYLTGAYGALINGNYQEMAEHLQEVEKQLHNSQKHYFFYHNYLSAWLSLVQNNFHRGSQHAKLALDIARSTGYVYHEALALFVQAQILFRKGDHKEANGSLDRFQKLIDPIDSRFLQYMHLLARSRFAIDLGKVPTGLKYLRQALKIGRDENYQTLMCWWDPPAMTMLCLQAMDNGIETEYVKDLIERQFLVPSSAPIEIEDWPWPVRIYTLGRFDIVKNGKPVRSRGKAQQKPLAMLKGLISLGGRNVSELHLAEAMWPDADGDMQHQSLATTLHRLRRLLGKKDMIEIHDGNISLNSSLCWVDTWAFERLLSLAADEAMKKKKNSDLLAADYAEKAIKLYKGSFLAQNTSEHWSIRMREHLKNRFLRGVTFLGRYLEKIGERERAVEFYLKALEADPLVEEFYQRVMICYHRLGRDVDAVLIYRRCLKNFDRLLQVRPSTQTRALYNNLVAKSIQSAKKS